MSMLSAMDGSDRRNLNKATKKQKFALLIFDYIAFFAFAYTTSVRVLHA